MATEGWFQDEVIVHLTQAGYLTGIRKQIATKYIPEVERSGIVESRSC